ncbi:MAG TPA: aminotransferase class III-fold pyridoxal phosphate-dependent enzyme, partial [Acidimicrobiales bacterium]|nr:aminotransferase class III-fold pyridoxal phosphate-dependent enzyme [Acidimicrobiales bacterium]
MSFDLAATLERRRGENFALHSRHLNPQLARVLKTLGWDRDYVRGEGCYLWDADGRRYLDLLSGFGVYALGRSHPTVKAALHAALDADTANLVQLDCGLLPGLLAEQLVARTHPGIERVFFCNSGAEAVEAAIKFARRHTGRERVLHASHSFHGLTTGALSLNGGREYRQGFGAMLPADPVAFGDIDALERELRRGDVAAFVVEPIQGKGVYEAPDDYWPAVQEACRRHRTLFVADEVQTGLGRTGRMWCHEHWGLQPDIITTSKALSGGYVPVGAMLTSDQVFRSVYDSMDHAVVHSSTFGSNDLAMVAGLATLAVMDDEDIVDRAARTGELWQKAMEPLVERYELISEVRGKGLMIGIEFAEPASRGGLRRRWKTVEAMRTGLMSQLVVVPLFHRHGILTQVAADDVNVVKLLPPLIAGEDEIKLFVDAFDDVMADAHEGR